MKQNAKAPTAGLVLLAVPIVLWTAKALGYVEVSVAELRVFLTVGAGLVGGSYAYQQRNATRDSGEGDDAPADGDGAE